MENCEDGQGKGKICRRMKKNGCKNQEYGKKNCRKTCDMCGKNISIRKSHFVSLNRIDDINSISIF